MSTWSPHRITVVATTAAIVTMLASAGFVLSSIASAQVMATPIADDYSWLHYVKEFGPGGFVVWFLTGLTGRFSNAAFMAVSIGIFGDAAIVVVPVILLFGLLAGTIVLVSSLLRFVPEPVGRMRWPLSIAVGAITVTAAVTSLPSIFDSLIWFNSVCIFLTSLTAFVWLLVLWIKVIRLAPARPVWLVALGVATYLTQGFAETTGAVVIAFAGLALIASRIWARFRRAWLVHLVVLGAAILGLLTVYILPGTAARNAIQDDLFPENSLQKIVRGGLHTGLIVTDIATSWRVVLVIALGFAIWIAFRSGISRHPLVALGVGAFLAVIPVVATGFVTYATVQSEPYRTQTVSVVLSVVGMAVAGAAVLTSVERIPRATAVLAVIAVVAAPAGALAALPALSSITQAVALRQSLTDYRADLVRAQVAEGETTIVVPPAPILLASSDSVDFSYNDIEVDWFERVFSDYFGLDDLSIERDLVQPVGYCLASDRSAFPNNASVAVYFGAQTCGELVASNTK